MWIKMKLIIFFLGLFALQTRAFSIADEDVEIYRAIQQAGISPYVMEEQVRAWLEGIFQSLRDKGLDPLNLEEKTINVTNKLIDIHGEVRNAHLENLVNISISDLKLTVLPLSLKAKLSWEPIRGYTDYDIDGKILELIPAFGKGHAEGLLEGLFVSFYGSVKSGANNSIIIKELTLDYGISNVNVNADGLLGGDLGTLICDIINDEAVTLLGQFKDGYGEQVKAVVTKAVNKFLEGKTVQDIIDMITGKPTTTPKPTTEAPY